MTTTRQLDELLAAAGEAGRTLPPAAETAEVHRRLVAEIRLRLPGAERAAAAAAVRSRDWYRHLQVVDDARAALEAKGEEPDLRVGPMAAALRVGELARHLRALSVYPAEGEVGV
ncbi:hypothetical protein GCM10018785_59380 [Streptomyces longispororuber]|uniref:Uncharacterized protein n=1 Tax=Streptomyces longispororuber TaxID=68230 RepID=A0A919A3R0_9ACTN|nr:DUF6415 family natural product biosynthesis protein [Streptomyces longispororuber]GHE83544.1 hypothetical protein GCM10018785_59380 [Streptomyces longispororuber]